MDINKFGLFIKKLRVDNGLTQEELAQKIPIDRTAVSKWERGVTMPDSSSLLRLSKIFNVTINDLLNGDYVNKNDEKVIVNLYEANYKNKKIIKIISFLMILLVISFLFIYFIFSFKKTRLYKVNGQSENYEVNDGFLLYTNEVYYFYLGNLINKNNKNIDKVELLLENNNKSEVVYKGDFTNTILTDFYGYDEYGLIDFAKKDYSVILKIFFEDNEESMKLNFLKDYINNYFIPKKRVKSSFKKAKNDIRVNKNIKKLINKIKHDENININNDYILKYNSNTKIVTVFSNDNSQIWNYDISLDTLSFFGDKDTFTYNTKLECISSKCENANDEIARFWKIINDFIS